MSADLYNEKELMDKIIKAVAVLSTDIKMINLHVDSMAYRLSALEEKVKKSNYEADDL